MTAIGQVDQGGYRFLVNIDIMCGVLTLHYYDKLRRPIIMRYLIATNLADVRWGNSPAHTTSHGLWDVNSICDLLTGLSVVEKEEKWGDKLVCYNYIIT